MCFFGVVSFLPPSTQINIVLCHAHGYISLPCSLFLVFRKSCSQEVYLSSFFFFKCSCGVSYEWVCVWVWERESLFNPQTSLEAVLQQSALRQFTFLFTLCCKTRTFKFMVMSVCVCEKERGIIQLYESHETKTKNLIYCWLIDKYMAK